MYPLQYRQSSRMIALGAGSKAVGIGGMQHFTSTGLTLAVANFFEGSALLGGLLGQRASSTTTTTNTSP